jgi:hypothetical protein
MLAKTLAALAKDCKGAEAVVPLLLSLPATHVLAAPD